jgi:hypothetical protein
MHFSAITAGATGATAIVVAAAPAFAIQFFLLL